MPRARFPRYLAAIALVAILASTACEIVGTDEDSEIRAVTLTSHEGAITILAPGETYPCPSCELPASGSWRTVHLSMVEGQIFEFRAYFGGNLRDTRKCVWRGEQVFSVDWLNGQLNCIAWSPA
jgi:hypothetical protein